MHQGVPILGQREAEVGVYAGQAALAVGEEAAVLNEGQ